MKLRLRCVYRHDRGIIRPKTIIDTDDPDSLIDEAQAVKLLVNRLAEKIEDSSSGNSVSVPVSEVRVPPFDEVQETLRRVEGLTEEAIAGLYSEGHYTVQSIADIDEEDLLPYEGIGVKTAQKIIKAAIALIEEDNE